MLKIVVVDDDRLVTQALTTIINANSNLQVVACGHDGKQAIQAYEQYQPDVLLLDIRMPEQSGLVATQTIMQAHPQAKILLLTTFVDDEYIQQALQLGVKGYLVKQNLDAIIPAIKAVANNQSVFGNEIMNKIQPVAHTHIDVFSQDLTTREQEILTQVAAGKNNKEIAQSIYLSEGTVRNYISQLLDKLQVRDRTQLAIYYYQNCQN
ncbi:MAG: response regulator transcription factor [Lactobacillus sp.]|uniref:DNA-binding response regulator n=1 Tax=Bombilactobacillus bombi TaxID=1303590 RepID=A0A347SRN9_9LACO|nr:response regulator transcription factor [Bombilactobacillus bombi]MCO6541943.1 response regulator transcription factor [Lactobacillus sp.]AXX64698.1 DNA-binding response regulator [Bombilactobacillus bombi]MCO6542731.1 response regulator transcription factor [Lactobacillus sp.]RHW46831.1 DNA-binding response regulator [Bombilactobacillus bombi]RHW50019.1 DNA-binding response regulator [Bombilactobacillus bombi]